MIFRRSRQKRRCGAAAVEMALLTPPLLLLAVITVDFGRVFYANATISNCARNGALYASDPAYAAASPYTSTAQAALADAPNLSPAPTVTTASGTDTMGNPYNSVTVTYQFSTIFNYPGIPSSNTISRTVQMRSATTAPY